MATTIVVPDALVQAIEFIDRNSTAIIGILAVVLLASITTEVIKRKWLKGHLQAKYINEDIEIVKQKVQAAVAWLLLASASAFTYVGFAIFFLDSTRSTWSQLPVVGEATTSVLGLCYLFYSFKGSKWYQRFAAWASKFSKTKTESNLPQPELTQPVVVDQLV